jgi:glycosyltransferase involved in cell wall biosynthesis
VQPPPGPLSRTAALLSFRLGGSDGVAVVAATWQRLLEEDGWVVRTVAGHGPVDRLLPGLAWPVVAPPPSLAQVADALDGCDVVIVENLCSLPLNPGATAVVVEALRGRAAVLHHHDLPWQRERFAGVEGWPADDPAWRHVTVNDLTRRELAARGVVATTIRNGFDVDVASGDGDVTRAVLGIDPSTRLLLHPVRAIERKDVPAAVQLAEALGATYWLTGPAEEGYDDELYRVLAAARCPLVHQAAPAGMAGAYAAADAVAFPSRWEGFGNPLIESAIHRRPLAVRPYPVAVELAELGFRWFPVDDPAPLAAFLDDPDGDLLDRNLALAREHFSLATVARGLAELLATLGFGA